LDTGTHHRSTAPQTFRIAAPLSEEQADFARECIRNGGEYIVARSIDDVQAAGL
jgi:hypothetical protein